MRRNESVERILAEWQEQRANGVATPPEEVITAHPDCADQLRARFRALRALDPTLDLPPGVPQRIGDFRILCEIDRGGMGVVYEAEQTSMRRKVALKVLSPLITTTPRAVKRFQREAQAAGRLHHTNIVPIHGLGQHAGYWYYAMELVHGRPLSSAIADLRAAARPPTERSLGRIAADVPSSLTPGTGTGTRAYFLRLAEMFAGVAEALHLAHAEGVVHRDIKPSNLLLDADGTLKIVDFGLARIAQDEAAMTVTGDLLGTPTYMSPEQAAGKRDAIDHRTDIYSLGATLYEVLALRPPFRARDLAALCALIARRDPMALRRLDRRIPRDLETIVAKAMEKEPAQRYASAGELATDLRRFAAGNPVHARRVWAVMRMWRRLKRHRTVSALAAAALLVAVLGAHFARRAAEEAQRARELEYSRLCALAGAATGWSQPSPEQAVNPDLTICVDPGVQLSEDARHPGWAARDLYSRAIDILPERPEAYVNRALVAGQGREARYADLDAALARGLSRRTWHLARAHLLGLERRFDEAQREREVAAALSGETPADAYCEATVLTLIGEHELAVKLLSKAIEESRAGDAVHSLALRARIRARIRMRDDEGALADLHALRDAGAHDIPLLVCLAGTWRRLGRLERSDLLFEESIAAAAHDGRLAAWMELCQATRAHGTNATYLRVTEEALAAHAGRVELMRERAIALFEAKRLEEALETAERARAAAPGSHAVNETLAAILNALARRPDALAAIDAALEADNECPTARNRRGSILMGLRRFEEARDAFGEAMRLDPAFARAHRNLALVLRKLRRFDDALQSFEDALRVDPHFVEAYVSRGAMRADDLRQPDEALEDFDRAIAVDPDIAAPHANRGIVLERRGELEEAHAAYAQAVALAPGVLDHRLKLWRIMRKRGLLDELAADRARIIEEAADDPSMRLVRARALLASERFDDALAAVEAALVEEPRSTALRFEKAVALEHLQRLEETVEALDDLIALDPMLPVAHSNRALLLAKLGHLDEALEANARALEVDPGLAAAMSDRGLIFRYMGQLDRAMEAYRKATEIEPDSVRAHSLMAYHLNWLGQYEEAVKWARRAVDLDPGSAHAHSNLASNLAACGQHAEALEIWDKTIRLAPADVEAHAERARSLCRLGRLDDALAAARKAIDLDPDGAEGYLSLALVAALHFDAGRLDEADDIVSRGIAMSTKVTSLYYERARIRLEAKRHEEALEDIETAVGMAPKDAQCHNLHGLVLRALGRHEEALAAYRKAIAIDARQAKALGNIAGILVDQLNRLDEGLEAVEKWLAVEPDDPDAHNLKGWVFWRTHRFEEAIPCYRRGLALAPRHAYLIRNLAMVLNATQRYDEALEVLAPLDEVQPVLVSSYGEQGYALWHTGRHKEAADAFRRVIGIQPDGRPAYRHLVDVFLEMREAELARRVCVEARGRWPAGIGFQRRLVTALRMLGKHDLAREQAREFTARKPDRKDLEFVQLCAVAGKREEALAELERWREDETHWARYRGAVVYAILGDHDRAVEWLREGIDRGLYLPPTSPPDPELEALRTHASWAALARRLHERQAEDR